jgi:hypothetical protein
MRQEGLIHVLMIGFVCGTLWLDGAPFAMDEERRGQQRDAE